MKSGALMLVIEKQYSNVEELLNNYFYELNQLQSIQLQSPMKNEINIKNFNYNGHIPNELINHLFLRVKNNWLWLTNNIKFQWLAILKR